MGAIRQLKCSCHQCALSCFCLAKDLIGGEKSRFDAVVQRQRMLERGDTLFMVGDRFNAVYILHSGSAKSYVISESGEQQITGFHLPGDLIGVDGLDNYIHAYGLEALETTSVCELMMADLDQMIASSWSLRHRFMSLLGRAVVDGQQMLLTLGKLSAEQRFARFLLTMSSHYAALGASSTEFNLTMSRYDIANFLGLVVETVSRLIRRFQEQGVIEVKRRWIHILDADKLHSYLSAPTDYEKRRLDSSQPPSIAVN